MQAALQEEANHLDDRLWSARFVEQATAEYMHPSATTKGGKRSGREVYSVSLAIAQACIRQSSSMPASAAKSVRGRYCGRERGACARAGRFAGRWRWAQIPNACNDDAPASTHRMPSEQLKAEELEEKGLALQNAVHVLVGHAALGAARRRAARRRCGD